MRFFVIKQFVMKFHLKQRVFVWMAGCKVSGNAARFVAAHPVEQVVAVHGNLLELLVQHQALDLERNELGNVN
jgi:hypothetical protein